MNPRSLFLVAIATGSASIGAVLAVMTHVNPTSVNPTSSLPLARSIAPVSPSEVLSPNALAPQPAPPLERVTITTAEPSSTEVTAAEQAAIRRELMQVKTQIRRAIHDRNAKLLRSLIQAGSIRETLRSLDLSEDSDFENLDASAWKLLETAATYHCLWQPDRHPTEPTSIAEVERCLNSGRSPLN
ncbi:MAG: hypothetical protein MUF72_19685 [Elainella sp. Prado103]|nr:hypothetical protein [Elainella sp. Prado103]